MKKMMKKVQMKMKCWKCVISFKKTVFLLKINK
ncbi:Uncharacterised protein [Klebsiella pneumoniae]|nr:Uncharacterised protein [Klebsiella pneumoniae]